MAKMFYSLEETAEKLGVSVDDVKALATNGKLQQFRDRDRLVFKRDQVDQLAEVGLSGDTASDASGSVGPIALVDSGGASTIGDADILDDTDAIDLLADTARTDSQAFSSADSGTASGISVFDADEIELADPRAQTQLSGVGEDSDLSLESIGSGSGLLDLTHESDDTSLGAELIDEIMPGGTGVADAQGGIPSGTGIFEEIAGGAGPEGQVAPTMLVAALDDYDPPASAFSAGMLLGAMIALILALTVAVSGLMDAPLPIIDAMGKNVGSVLLYAGVLLIVSLAMGGIGFLVGKKKTA